MEIGLKYPGQPLGDAAAVRLAQSDLHHLLAAMTTATAAWALSAAKRQAIVTPGRR